MRVYVEGVGLRADGLDGWRVSLPVVAGDRSYTPVPLNLPPSPLLPPAERRRTVATVRLALLVGADAFDAAKRDPGTTATVFASSGGDGATIHNILESLAVVELDVSPTRFHNSVHNAPSGYWNIATRSREPTTSLCAHDASFAAGFLEAAVQATLDQRAIGLIAYDLPYPEPLNASRPIMSMFGVSLIVTPIPTAMTFASLSVALDRRAEAATPMRDGRLEALRAGNPAARSLPLLAALARRAETRVVLDHTNGNVVVVSVAPTA